LMNSTSATYYSQIGSDQTPGAVLQTNTPYRLTYSVQGTSDTELRFTLSATGGTLSNFNFSTTSNSGSSYFTSVFDAFAFYSLSTSGISFGIDNLVISHTAGAAAASSGSGSTFSAFDLGGPTVIPEPSTYAACAGAAVLGLAFWRRRRAAAQGGSS